jgi:colicin import membrane protein
MGRNEKPSTETALAVIAALTPESIYTPGGVDAILDKIVKEVRGTIIDVSTKAGREAANSLAYKVARTKTALDDMGKDLVADWKAKAKLVDDDRKTIRDRLDALKAEVKEPVDVWEKAEADRVAGHLNAITEIEDLVRDLGEPTSEAIAQRQAVLQTIINEARDWQEFGEQAAAATIMIRTQLAALLEGAIKREADAAELNALRAEKAERDRKDAEAAAARQAEEDAKAEAAAAEQRRINSEAEKQRAADAAVEAERKRVADAAAAEEAARVKRERNQRHRTKIIREAVVAFERHGLDDQTATRIVAAIMDGDITNVTLVF